MFFNLIVSLPYIRINTSNDLFKTSTLKLQTPNINQSTCNPHPTHHLSTELYLICPKHPKYFNSDTCSNHNPSTQTLKTSPSSPLNTITLLLPALTFRPLLVHITTKHPTIAFRFSFDSLYKTKSFVYKRPGNLHSLYPHPHFHFITASIYTLKSKGDMIQPYLIPLLILKTLSPSHIPTSYILSTCHSTYLLTLSYAFSKSIKPIYTLHFHFHAFSHICFRVKI